MADFDSLTTPHWASSYIGKPWASGKSGPDSYDCWGLVKAVLEKHYTIRVPLIKVAEDNLKAIVTQFRNNPERQRWAVVESPQDGDVALLRQSRYPCHVGLWLEVDHGGILHSMQDVGVVFQKEQDLKVMGWSVEGFYRYCGNSK